MKTFVHLLTAVLPLVLLSAQPALAQTGSLQVTISPQAAIDAGAQWRVDGGAWRDSDYTEPNLVVGSYTVEYSVIANWNEPNSQTVQINDAQTTNTLGTYVRQTGSLQVTISPQAAIDAGAQWRVDGGTWRDSGYTGPNLVVGSYTVEYSVIAGWNEPNSQTVQINDAQTTTTLGTYVRQTGSLQVTISPQAAIDAGAQWRVDGGAWQDSGYTEPNLAVGSYTVEYSVIAGWNEPNSQTIQINDAQTTTASGTYVRHTGSLQVTISPQEAIDAGAQWRVNGGLWRDSNDIEPNLVVGLYTVEYKPLPSFIEPNSQTVQIDYNQTTVTSGTYIPTGSLQVTISPQAAIDAGAQWRVDGGLWHDSNDIEPNLVVGPHTVEYKPLPSFIGPNSRTVQIYYEQTTITSGTYIPAGSLQVIISPQEAINNGAQWRVDGGLWHDSNDIESNLFVGTHTVEYKPLANFREPNSRTVQIYYEQTTITSGTYILTGALQVTILPQEAIDAGAQWRVDGGTWRYSGSIESGLVIGPHTVECSVIAGWDEPNSRSVQINYAQITGISCIYVQQTGSLQVTIFPKEATDVGARWRVDNGLWRNSDYIQTDIPVGYHLVEYKSLPDWNPPANEIVEINDDLTTSTTGTYVPTGSLQVILMPQAAVDAGAQWRVDGGNWNDSTYIKTGLSVGAHIIEYKPITGWNTPDNETIQINHAEVTTKLTTYISKQNSLQVTIIPQEAIDAGAQWRADGGIWRDSNDVETDLAIGYHLVEYKTITNWKTPASEIVEIVYGQTTSITGTYIPTGSLQVTITPQEAIDTGAQWRVDGGVWWDSNDSATGLSAGFHIVEYKPLTSWDTPANETVQVDYNEITTITGTYIRREGSLQVTILPQEAIDAGAQWRVDSGDWLDSGHTETELLEGSHRIEYKPIPGWNKPANETVWIDDGQTTNTSGVYIRSGSLQVTIAPQGAIDAGAQWRVDGGLWQDSNDIKANLLLGAHTVEYKPIFGWNEPNSQTVQIDYNEITTITGTYIQQMGSLHVTILPQEAIDAGAQWRVDGGLWRDSDTEPNVGVGSHTVEYKPIYGWNEPNSQMVHINLGQTTDTSGTYIRQRGSLQVTIAPQEAIDAGAQWRVDGGLWHDSNDIEHNLGVGPHTIEYKATTNWNEPNSQTVQIEYGQTTTTSGTYIQSGSLRVAILPQAAIDAGAQWRVDGGLWRDSNDIEPNLAVGTHSVEYKHITNWSEPNSQTVQIEFGQTAATSGTYIRSGSLRVTIAPQEAVGAGAQWRVDGGAWRDSNYVETDLPIGSYTVEYKPLFGWNEPNSETVQIEHGQTTATTGTYIRQRGSLRVIIEPNEANDAGAQWRVDGGLWHDSNDIEPNLGVGPHTVEYKPLTNFNEPNSQTVQIEYGQTTTTTGTYILTGWLQVTIDPNEAIDAGAQWRVDGGLWHDSNDIEPNLAVGTHSVEYKHITNWNEPNSQAVQINHGQMTTTSGTYIRSGLLRVTIAPQEAIDAGAQWRVVGGTWRDSNDTEPNLAIGSHTVEYKPLYGWNEPNSETVRIDHGQTTTTSATYIRQRGSLRVIIEPNEVNDIGAQWRVDGGLWHDSNDTEPNLGVGPHIVEYKPITNWNEPNTQTVQIYYKQMTTTTGTYVKSGLLHVTIAPQEAIDAGAQWRVDGGLWHDSNHIEPNIPIGLHTVEYMPLFGWTEPNSQTLQINHGQTTATSGTYIRQKGLVQVTIAPQEAIDAGAQWRVDGGTWHDSNDTEPNLYVGYHMVEYMPVTNWGKPDNEMVLINHDETTTVLGTYFSSGSLQVTIAPQEAIDAWAQWRVDSGPWHDSNDIETNLPVGSHIVEYKPIADFNEPNSQTVRIEHGQTTTITGTYRYHTGSLHVIILPPEANDAGAQWRVDGGTWRDSNYTEPNLVIGSHTVEYKSAGNAWNIPANETVPIFYNQTTIINGIYILRTPSGTPPIKWHKTFGGSDSDYGESVRQTSDGGFITAGHTFYSSTFDYDVYLVKTDTNGDIMWQNTFGGGDWDYGQSVQQTSDGGYIIAGYTYSYGAGETDFYLIKIDSSGNQDWDTDFGGYSWDEAYSVQQTSDGGYIIAGSTYSFGAGGSDVYVIKTDSRGRKEYEWTYGGTEDDHAWSVQQTSDGGYIITGYTSSYGAGQRDVYLIKITSTGTMQWQNTFNGSADDVGYSVQQTADGGYIVAGYTSYWCPSDGGQQYDVYLIKTEPNGNSQWQKEYPGSDDYCSGDELGYSVHQTFDGGYIIAGETTSYGKGATDVYLIRTDPNGNIKWQKAFGGSDHDYAGSVQQTSEGGYIIAGSTYSFGAGKYDVYLAKVCRDGTSCADFNCDDIIDFEDLKEFAGQWLQPGFPHGDIAPEIGPDMGDGIVNFLDFSVFAHDWLYENIAP